MAADRSMDELVPTRKRHERKLMSSQRDEFGVVVRALELAKVKGIIGSTWLRRSDEGRAASLFRTALAVHSNVLQLAWGLACTGLNTLGVLKGRRTDA